MQSIICVYLWCVLSMLEDQIQPYLCSANMPSLKLHPQTLNFDSYVCDTLALKTAALFVLCLLPEVS